MISRLKFALLTTKGWAIKVAVVDEDFRLSFISGNLTRIRIDSWKYNPYVLYEFLQNEMGAKMLEGLQTGTTIKLLNNSQLVCFMDFNPPLFPVI